ncbi:MAG: hypothetical protein KME11_10440 [Timaviella obliquedivisa GSE-PSE-MK23-08B]|jgi:hypothetical protein|nr:hypothetical protein [Timaviella obliquedivisa GSE-PSE-MK23-08B]
MPFTTYKGIGDVLKDYQIVSMEMDFVTEVSFVNNEAFKADIEFSLREVVFDNSEYAVCENLIYPTLKEVYKRHKEHFSLWSHQPISFNEKLCGIPDYIVAKRSPLGKFVFDQPYIIVVEAKRDDFAEGWGQCLAEMVAVQKLNSELHQPIFGIVSNGKVWEFGRLVANQFVKNIKVYTIYDLNCLMNAINGVFVQCEAAIA